MNSFPNKILLATDGSENTDLAARAAIELSNRTASELHVVHVWHDVPTPPLSLFRKGAAQTGSRRDSPEAARTHRAGGRNRRGGPPQGRKDHRRDPRPERGAGGWAVSRG